MIKPSQVLGFCFMQMNAQADAKIAALGPTRPAEIERESPSRRSAPAICTDFKARHIGGPFSFLE
ncbi:hypothetical protein B1F69_03905 [Pseudomonas syringae]|nr:hypothetical protein B1F69_03905 [Pseudomonas syringae]